MRASARQRKVSLIMTGKRIALEFRERPHTLHILWVSRAPRASRIQKPSTLLDRPETLHIRSLSLGDAESLPHLIELPIP
jgi:hypothetical protein